MSEILIIISVFLITLGIFFMFVGSVGILRLPDFYSRTHTISKGDTLGIFLVIIGLIVYEGFTQSSLKLLLIVFFIALSNPVGGHALAKAAYTKGLKPFLSGNKEEADKK